MDIFFLSLCTAGRHLRQEAGGYGRIRGRVSCPSPAGGGGKDSHPHERDFPERLRPILKRNVRERRGKRGFYSVVSSGKCSLQIQCEHMISYAFSIHANERKRSNLPKNCENYLLFALLSARFLHLYCVTYFTVAINVQYVGVYFICWLNPWTANHLNQEKICKIQLNECNWIGIFHFSFPIVNAINHHHYSHIICPSRGNLIEIKGQKYKWGQDPPCIRDSESQWDYSWLNRG